MHVSFTIKIFIETQIFSLLSDSVTLLEFRVSQRSDFLFELFKEERFESKQKMCEQFWRRVQTVVFDSPDSFVQAEPLCWSVCLLVGEKPTCSWGEAEGGTSSPAEETCRDQQHEERSKHTQTVVLNTSAQTHIHLLGPRSVLNHKQTNMQHIYIYYLFYWLFNGRKGNKDPNWECKTDFYYKHRQRLTSTQ